VGGDAPEVSADVAGCAAVAAAWLDHLAVERGLAANSLLAYRRDLDRYVDSLGRRGISEMAAVDASDITAHLVELRNGAGDAAPLAASSVARAAAVIRGLHRFAAVEGLVAGDAGAEVRPPRPAGRLPKALALDQVEQLLDAAVLGPRVDAGLRDRALLELLYATGARISEAVTLDLDDVTPLLERADAGGWRAEVGLRLAGKGGKQRVVPVGRAARDALDAYLVRGRPSLAVAGVGTPATFLNARGGRLSRQSAWTALRSAATRAGVPTTALSPHVLRHSFATHLMQGGADVRVVQELLGHASVATTQIYTLVTVDAVREVYATAHPRARRPEALAP